MRAGERQLYVIRACREYLLSSSIEERTKVRSWNIGSVVGMNECAKKQNSSPQSSPFPERERQNYLRRTLNLHIASLSREQLIICAKRQPADAMAILFRALAPDFPKPLLIPP